MATSPPANHPPRDKMNEFKQIEFDEETQQKYWEGGSNRFARLYTYLQRGFGLFNEAKNYILMLFGAYWTIKTMDIWVKYGFSETTLIVMLSLTAVFGIIFLVVIGRWELYKLSKAREFAVQQHGTVTRYDPYNMQVEQTKLLGEILEELQRK